MAVLYGLPVILGLTTESVRSSAYKSIWPCRATFPNSGPASVPVNKLTVSGDLQLWQGVGTGAPIVMVTVSPALGSLDELETLTQSTLRDQVPSQDGGAAVAVVEPPQPAHNKSAHKIKAHFSVSRAITFSGSRLVLLFQ